VASTKSTIKDVAKQAGVSIATVSRYLHNSSSVKKESQKRISQAVKDLQYRPHLYARKLAGGRLDTFGLVIPGYEGIFYSFYALEIMRSVAQALESKEYDLHLHIFWGKDRFKTSLVEAVIFADVIGNKEQLLRVLEEGVPCVVINKRIEDAEVSYIAVDNFKGAYEATDFLIHQGHKRIAHLTGDLKAQCATERLEGYKYALKKNAIEARDKYIKMANFSPLLAREKTEELLSSKERPSAIFCASDEMAFEVLNIAYEKHIAVPDELSVIGFDDHPQSLYARVPLTTVRQPFRKMALLATEMLEGFTKHKDMTIRREIVSPELVIRDSAGCL